MKLLALTSSALLQGAFTVGAGTSSIRCHLTDLPLLKRMVSEWIASG